MNSFVQRWVATREGFKPRDVEEPIDYYWHRPVAGLLVQLLEHTKVTANQVTFASAGVSLLSGFAIAAGVFNRWWVAVGGLLLFLSIVLDCADGQLARIRGTSSVIGRILDGTMDIMAPLAVFHGMAAYLLIADNAPHAYVWPIGWAAGGSLLWHTGQYDVCKNIYLHATRPDFSLGGSTLLSLDDIRRFQKEFDDKGERFNSFLMSVWKVWTTPQLKSLAAWRDPSRTPANDDERALFLRIFGPQMRAYTWIGFGGHLFLLTMAALIAPIDSRAIWVAWGIMLGPMNVIALWIVFTQGGRERRFDAALAAMRDES